MKKVLLLSLLLFSTGLLVEAQKLKKVLELKMPTPSDEDIMGTRGAGVAWHPEQKKYYAVFAGNEDFPLAAFDAKGKRLNDTLVALVDTRGIWYNPATKSIAGNAYGDIGWFTYKLNKSGFPTDYSITLEGENQPDPQSVGAYNPSAKMVMFASDNFIYMLNSKGELKDSALVHFATKKAEDIDEEEDIYASESYNTSMIYTGIKGQELGFLNIDEGQIELYDIKSGLLKKTLELPEDAPIEEFFNFAYANGIYWLFDIEARIWKGYK